MTEKEKAKAYDEAIEKAKKLYSNGVTEEIFPELKENDDEKIRRWIIDDIRYNINNEPLNNSEYKKKAEKAIAWLEGTKFALENQWINVESKLPCNDGHLFLIYCKVYRKKNNIISNEHYEIYLAYFDKDDLSWYGMIDYNNYEYDVLYWIPIPEPPKE